MQNIGIKIGRKQQNTGQNWTVVNNRNQAALQ